MQLLNFSTMYKLSLSVVLFFLFPFFTHAQVLFSEIAWMGTDTSANDEWIELYNLGNSPTDVSGWTINLNGEPFITLSGSIGPHGIVVLERSDDVVVSCPAFQIYTGALVNTGATLTIKDQLGNVSDEAVGGTDWKEIGGSNVKDQPKMTPQRTRNGTWVTGVPTPCADNVQENGTIPEGSPDEEEETTVETSKVKSTGGSSKSILAPVKKLPGVLSLSMRAPKIAYVNQEVEFEVVPEGVGPTILSSLGYTWNFGDTYTASGKKNTHIYKYPGEYVVMVGAEFAKQSATARHEVKVLPISITMERTSNDDILIKNTSGEEVDLEGFVLKGNTSFEFPRFSIIKSKGSLTISKERVQSRTQHLALYDTQGVRVAGDTQEHRKLAEAGMTHVKQPSQKVVTPLAGTHTDVSLELPDSDRTETLVSADTQNIIQIGNTEQVEKMGIFSRFFRSITSFFD